MNSIESSKDLKVNFLVISCISCGAFPGIGEYVISHPWWLEYYQGSTSVKARGNESFIPFGLGNSIKVPFLLNPRSHNTLTNAKISSCHVMHSMTLLENLKAFE